MSAIASPSNMMLILRPFDHFFRPALNIILPNVRHTL
jgi:hypothetical protein